MAVISDADGDFLKRTANLPASDAFTATLWFKRAAATPAANDSIVFLDTGTSTNYVGIAWSSTTALALWDTAGSVNFSSAPASGAWVYLAISRTGSALKGYYYTQAGVLVTQTRTFATTYTPGAFTVLCNGFSTSQSCRGTAAAIKLWDAQLSDAEIAAERFTITPQRLTNLNDFWPCMFGATERLRGYYRARNFTAGGTLTDEGGPPIPWSLARIIVYPTSTAAAESGDASHPATATLSALATGQEQAALTTGGQAAVSLTAVAAKAAAASAPVSAASAQARAAQHLAAPAAVSAEGALSIARAGQKQGAASAEAQAQEDTGALAGVAALLSMPTSAADAITAKGPQSAAATFPSSAAHTLAASAAAADAATEAVQASLAAIRAIGLPALVSAAAEASLTVERQSGLVVAATAPVQATLTPVRLVALPAALSAPASAVVAPVAVTGLLRALAFQADAAAVAAELLAVMLPDALVASGNLRDTGAAIPPVDLTDIQDDPHAGDADWWTAVNPTLDIEALVSLADLEAGLQMGGTWTVELLVRKTAGAPDPTVDVELWESGSFVATLLSGQTVSSTSGVLLTPNFDPAVLADPTGAMAQIRVVGHAA